MNSIKDVFHLEENDSTQRGRAKDEDLLKMHAYRDAIKRSAGAYVLFPGSETRIEILQAYEEILPGIGALPFRVAADGTADETSVAQLSRFLNDVIDHLANQASSDERVRYWTHKSHSTENASVPKGILDAPPADTSVLLGYVKDDEHLVWIRHSGLYNLRADSRDGSVTDDPRALSTQFLLLYGPSIEVPVLLRRTKVPLLVTGVQMLERRYPNPGGSLYCLLPFEIVEGSVPRFQASDIDAQLQKHSDMPVGYPCVVTWDELAY